VSFYSVLGTRFTTCVSRPLAFSIYLVCFCMCPVCAAGDIDSDGDGLSDFQEVHKYLTSPGKKDTDGDGVSDGGWDERREYAYSVRSILRFMPPFDEDALNDDFQDARVLEKTDDYIELEVIHYPLGTAHESIRGNPNWRRDCASMTEYLKPGVTTNWDDKMRQDLLDELKADGILVDKLTDRQVVTQVSSWLRRKSKSLDKVFTTYYIYYPKGQPKVYPGLENAFEGEFNRDKDNYDWTIGEHFDRELLGRGMFYNKTHGSCTSFAVSLTTVLRAVGIPTRMIITVPVVDPSDKEQRRLVKDRITHNQVHETMLAGLRRVGQGFTAHTFNEVYIGNRWHRLNGNRLGQPILDPRLFGLHTHLYTFNDLSDANLAPTWGFRYGKGARSAVLKHSNPYSAVTLSDLFGCHCSIENPVAADEGTLLGSLPNIYIMGPSEPPGWFTEVVGVVEGFVASKTGRHHDEKSYDEVFVDGIWGKKSGDIIVLLLSLDVKDRVPVRYEDLLPRPWSEIEAALRQGQTVELAGKAREMKIILLAAPKGWGLRQLIRESKLLSALTKHNVTSED